MLLSDFLYSTNQKVMNAYEISSKIGIKLSKNKYESTFFQKLKKLYCYDLYEYEYMKQLFILIKGVVDT